MRNGSFGILGVFILAIVLVVPYQIVYYNSAETIEITITGKERIVESSGESTSSKYLIHAEDESFQNTDDMWYWKYTSTDFQRELEEGNTYTVTVVGWRYPVFSMYRNIVEIKE